MPTALLWGGALIVAMLIMLYATLTAEGSTGGAELGSAPADD